MRIFLTGSTGQLGHELTELLRQDEVYKAKRPEDDITDEKIIDRIRQFNPEAVVHAAGYTDVDGCEKNRDLAHRVNAIGAQNVAIGADKCGAKLVYLSTDYVFSGKKRSPYVETDIPHPINAYGQSKWEGEQFVDQSCPRHVILRTSWLYGRVGKNFVQTILRLAGQPEELRVVSDQVGCPTYARDLALAVAAIIKKEAFGVYHAAGEGACSWFEFAGEIIRLAGVNKKVVAISSWEIDRPARRPRYSALSQNKLNGLGISLRHWKTALEDYFREMVKIS